MQLMSGGQLVCCKAWVLTGCQSAISVASHHITAQQRCKTSCGLSRLCDQPCSLAAHSSHHGAAITNSYAHLHQTSPGLPLPLALRHLGLLEPVWWDVQSSGVVSRLPRPALVGIQQVLGLQERESVCCTLIVPL